MVLLSIFNSFFFRSKSNPSIPAGFTIFCSVINFYNSLHNTKLQFQPPLFLKWHLCWDVSSYLKKPFPSSLTLYISPCVFPSSTRPLFFLIFSWLTSYCITAVLLHILSTVSSKSSQSVLSLHWGLQIARITSDKTCWMAIWVQQFTEWNRCHQTHR